MLGDVVAQQLPLVYTGDKIFAPLGPLHVPPPADLASSPKLPSHRFQGSLPFLLKFCDVNTEEELPTLYHELANALKGEAAYVLHQRFLQCAPIENLESTHSPVATPALINAITRCDFVGNLHELGMGLTPFLVTYVSQALNAHLKDLSAISLVFHSGANTLTLPDVLALKEASKLPLPPTMWHALITLKSFLLVLAEVFGPHNRLTTHYHLFIHALRHS